MPVARRGLLRIAACLPAGYIVGWAAAALGRSVSRAAPGLRPTPAGTSATRCAGCGATDHTMLDRRCPAARQVI